MASRKLAVFCCAALPAVAMTIPIGTNTVVERGDTLHVTGSEAAVEKLAPVVGRVIHPTDESDLAVLGIAIFVGVLVGAVIIIPIGHLRIALGTSVGTLLAGVIVGMDAVGAALVRKNPRWRRFFLCDRSVWQRLWL